MDEDLTTNHLTMKGATPAVREVAGTLVACPWCLSEVELAAGAATLDCPACRVVVELAPDPVPVVTFLTAA